MQKTLKMKVDLQNCFDNILDLEESLIKNIEGLHELCKTNGIEIPSELELDRFSSTPISLGVVAQYINELIDFAEASGDPVLTNILHGLGVAKEVEVDGSFNTVKFSGNVNAKGEYLRVDKPVLELKYGGQKYKAVIKENIEFKKDE